MTTYAARKRYLATPNGKAVHTAYTKRWRVQNRGTVLAAYRKHDLKRHYGMTPEGWDALFAAQGFQCAACGMPEPGKANGQWSTDHNHETGKVRGILCNGCNLALGHTKDDPNRLRMLATYLEERGPSDASH